MVVVVFAMLLLALMSAAAVGLAVVWQLCVAAVAASYDTGQNGPNGGDLWW